MSQTTLSRSGADRNLLFGIVALQMDFITREVLIAAMQAWVFHKGKSLGEILVEQGALPQDRQALLEALVQEHLRKHDNDPEQSLAAVSADTSVREELRGLGDSDLECSLAHINLTPPALQTTLGTPTSAGLRFRILRPHAKGGLGQVWVAYDEELHREVALKEIQDRYADHPDNRSRFILEAEITGGLQHPGVVPVYGLGQYADGRPFYAMRFIQGDNLKEAIGRFHKADRPGRDPGERGLALRRLLRRFVDVCNAMAYAHNRGVLHRDLKPGNIMLGQYGETLVIDWGLAKAIGRRESGVAAVEETLRPASASGSAPTYAGSVVGTPPYMSPEQAAGRLEELGPASDVYSLGATLYYLLTGKPPLEDEDAGAVLQKVQRGDFPPPRQVNRTVPPALEAVCLKAMALRPADRYALPGALADDVEHWLAGEPVSAWREPWSVTARRWLTRHHTFVVAGSAAVLVALVTLASATVLLTAANERERQAKERAQASSTDANQQRKKAEDQRVLAEEEKKTAETNFQLARDAVDEYYTKVSEEVLLNEPGSELLRKKLLEAAGEYYKNFVLQHGDDPSVQAGLGKALYRLAQITAEVGEKREAVKHYQDALKRFADLPAAGSGGTDYRSRQATCYDGLGRLYRHLGKAEEGRGKSEEAEVWYQKAEKSYQKALIFWNELVKKQFDNALHQAGLGRSLLGLGNVYADLKRLRGANAKYHKKAETAYQEALVIRTELARAHEDVEYHRDLSVSYNNFGALYFDMNEPEKKPADIAPNQPDKALTYYRQARRIQKELVRKNPFLSQLQQDLARTHFNLGNLYDRTDCADQAITSHRKALRLWNQLFLKHPAVAHIQADLLDTYNNLAMAYDSAEDLDRAIETCQEALKIRLPLPDDDQVQASVKRIRDNLKELQGKKKEKEKPQKAQLNLLTIRQKLAKGRP